MRNNNYPVRPESSSKVVQVKKKDIHEYLQEVNDSAAKLNEQMVELVNRFTYMQKTGVSSRLDERSVELFNTVLSQTKAMPEKVQKAVNTNMDKVIKQIDKKISEIKKLCIAITLFVNGIIAIIVLLLK